MFGGATMTLAMLQTSQGHRPQNRSERCKCAGSSISFVEALSAAQLASTATEEQDPGVACPDPAQVTATSAFDQPGHVSL